MDKIKDKTIDTAKDTVKDAAKEKAKDTLKDKVPEGLKSIYHEANAKMGGGGDVTADRYRVDFRSSGWSFVTAGVSAAVAKTLVAPLDMVGSTTSHETSVATQQGYMTYWRGNLSNIVRAFPNEGLNFALRDYYYKMMGVAEIDARREPLKYFWATYTGGGAAGVVSLAVLYPIDSAYGSRLPSDLNEAMAKELKLQGAKSGVDYDIGRISKIDPVQAGRETLDAAKGRIEDLKDTAKDAAGKVREGEFRKAAETVTGAQIKTGGFYGLYRGFVPSLMGAFVYRAAYFGAYDTVRAMYPDKSSLIWMWLIAQTTTTASSYLAHPFDMIRFRMMHQRERYASTWNCWAKTCQQEGFSSLYRGSSATMIRSTGGALTLVIYDIAKKWMTERKMI